MKELQRNNQRKETHKDEEANQDDWSTVIARNWIGHSWGVLQFDGL